MGAIVVFRIAVAVAGLGSRIVRWEQTASGQPGAEALGKALMERLQDPGETEADLTSAVALHTGTLADVTVYPDPFELRKLQVSYSRDSGVVAGEDVAVVTFHLAKVSGGSVVDTWAAGDFTTAKDAYQAFWTTMKPYYAPTVSLTRLAFYKAGPAIAPPQPPVHAEDVSVAGTNASPQYRMPPQVALTVTERAGLKPNWGRWYMIAPDARGASADTNTDKGRPTSTFLSLFADACDVMYEAWLAASLAPVVYRKDLPARSTAAGGSLPARAATAHSVDTLQVDDTYDVIRSRRWDNPTLRVLRGVGA